ATFIPYQIQIDGVALAGSRDVISASLHGVISYVTGIFPVMSEFSGSVDVTAKPSGDANDPSNIVKVEATNLSLSIQANINILAWTIVIAALSPFFSDTLSDPIAKELNKVIKDAAQNTINKLPKNDDGTPWISPTAIISLRKRAFIKTQFDPDEMEDEKQI